MSFSDEEETKRLLKEQLFYNVATEKPKIEKVNNVDMLRKLAILSGINCTKNTKVF